MARGRIHLVPVLLGIVAGVLNISATGAAWQTSPLVATSAAAQAIPSSPDRSEFPQFDGAILSLLARGQGVKVAARRLLEAPDDPETARLLAEQGRFEDALDVIRRIVEKHPDEIGRAFERLPLINFRLDPTHNYSETIRALVELARTRVTGLSGEQAAATAWALFRVEGQLRADSRTAATRLRAFIDEYAGTEVARLAEVDLIQAGPINLARLDALDAFARQHARSAAGAKALFQKAFDLAHNASALRIESSGADPTARFNQVVEIARELQSGAYPDCEWVGRAPELVIQFSSYRPKFSSPDHVEAMLTVYRNLVRTELPKVNGALADSSLSYVVSSKMGDLFELSGDRMAGIEGVFADLERIAPNPAEVRYWRALSYLRYLVEPTPNRAAIVAKSVAALRAMHAENAQPFARRALAALAALHFYERDYVSARTAYQQYLSLYPATDWAWVARIRLGQSAAAMGDTAGAASAYAAADAPETPPAGRVVARTFSSEALAELGRVNEAARAAERALADWDDDFGETYRTQASQALRPGANPSELANDTTITKIVLRRRVAELRASATSTGGAALEQARQLIARGRTVEAIPVLRRAVTESRGSVLESVARSLLHHAQLLEALARADADRPDADAGAALRLLDALGAEPLDFEVFAARIARATLLSRQPSDASAADALMKRTLDEWRTRQPRSGTPTTGSLETDVAAIRDEVFKPLGGGVYGSQHWNAFDWPAQLPMFLIANPSIAIKLSGGDIQHVSLRQPIPGMDALIFMDDDELGVLTRMITALGGTKRREPAAVMETPNQPAGASVTVQAFWNRYFPMRAGHWSGWVFETYPTITDVTFLDAARTKAAARVTVGYSGGTVMLVKEQGTWRAQEFVGFWVT